MSEDFSIALNEVEKFKLERKKALQKVKDLTVGTIEHDQYLLAQSKVKIAYAKFKSIEAQERILGFKSMQLFWERFCFFLGIFFYALYNLFQSYYFERRNTGKKVLHGLIISISIFYFFWIFQVAQDFSKPVYYIMIIATAYFLVLAVHLITKYQDHYINILKGRIYKLSIYVIKNTTPDKKNEMLDALERIAKND